MAGKASLAKSDLSHRNELLHPQPELPSIKMANHTREDRDIHIQTY
jgi:hypothetical protein